MSHTASQPTIEDFDAMIAETNQRLLSDVMDIVKRIAHDPCADIDPQIRLIEAKNSSRFRQINEKRKLERRTPHDSERRRADALA